MQAPDVTIIALLIVLPLLAWRVYTRVRKMVGRQRLSRARAWSTLTIFPLLIALLAYASHAHVQAFSGLAAGLAGGAILGLYGLRLTRFEATPEGSFYTPSAHLGVALSLLLVARILYRLFEIFPIDTTSPAATSLALSPLTLAVVGLLAGYYMAYAVGLVRWRNPAVSASSQ
jgi:hypothetical protein